MIKDIRELINNLSGTPTHEQLTFLRRFGKLLKLRIEKAMDFITEVVPKNGDSYFKDIIKSVIPNDDDSWILNDAIHWSLNKTNVVFVTLDGEIYHNREELLRKVMDFKYLNEAPMKIAHLGYN